MLHNTKNELMASEPVYFTLYLKKKNKACHASLYP